MKWTALLIAVGAFVCVAGLSVYLRVEQHRFRRQAERLLSDVRGLELEKAGAAQVKEVVRKWGFDEWGQGPGQPCTQDDCIYRFRFMPNASLGQLADPFGPGLMVRALEWLGSRPSAVLSSLEIRENTLTSLSFSVYTVGRGCEGQGRLDCTLMGDARIGSQGSSWSAYDQPDVKLKHSLLHPDYFVGTFPALFNADTGGSPSVVIWAEFSRDASAVNVSRLMQFDLSCLTRLRSCENRDLMPNVWAQSLADVRESPKSLTCTPELSKRVAQLADVIAVVRPKTVELSPPPYTGRAPQLRDLEVVAVIRKQEYPQKLTRLAVDVDTPEMMTAADSGLSIRAGQEYVFLLQVRSNPDIAWNALYPCGILSLNNANLAMAHEAGANDADR